MAREVLDLIFCSRKILPAAEWTLACERPREKAKGPVKRHYSSPGKRCQWMILKPVFHIGKGHREILDFADHALYCDRSALPLEHESSHRLYSNE